MTDLKVAEVAPTRIEQPALRIWHNPQVPGAAYFVRVARPSSAKRLLGILAMYDLFQFENNIKPDYTYAAGLEYLVEIDGQRDWHDWHHPVTDSKIDECTLDDLLLLEKEWDAKREPSIVPPDGVDLDRPTDKPHLEDAILRESTPIF